MKRTVSAADAGRRMDELLECVSRGDEVLIEREGEQLAVLIPNARYAELEAARERGREELRAWLEANWEMNKDVPAEEIEAEVAEAVREVRAARRKRSA